MFGKKFDLEGLKNYITIPFAKPKLEGVDNWDISTFSRHEFSYLLGEYKANYRYENTRMYQIKESHWGRNVNWNDMEKYTFKMQDSMRGHKKAYLRELCEDIITEKAKNNSSNSRRVTFIRKSKSYPLKNITGKDSYYEILKLINYPKSQWRGVIKDFQYVESLLLKSLRDADAIIVPQYWIDDRKANTVSKMRATKAAKGEKVAGDFNCKIGEELLRYNDGRNCKFVSHRINIESVEKGSCTYVYTNHDDYMLLDKLYEETKRMNIKYITFSTRELEALEKSPKIDNLVSYDNFIKGDDMFIKYITAVYCWSFMQKADNSDIFDKIHLIDKVKSKLSDKLKKVSEYQKLYIQGGRYQTYSNGLKFLELAQDNDLFNAEIYDLIEELDAFFKEHNYISTITGALSGGGNRVDGLLDCLAQLFRCNNVPINVHYQFLKHKREQEEQESNNNNN